MAYNFDEPSKCFIKWYICAIVVVVTGVGSYIVGSIGIQF